MAKGTFSLDNFRTNVLTKSLARTNRFEVFIFAPPGLSGGFDTRDISLLVETASLPTLNIAVKPFKIFGPSYQRPISVEYGGEGIPITFHVDRDMKTKKFFDEWLFKVVAKETYFVNYQNDYLSTVEIYQLDEQDNITYAIRLVDAFPRNVNLMELNNSSSNQTHRLNVLFAYRYWERILDKEETVVEQVIQTPEVPRPDASLPAIDAI